MIQAFKSSPFSLHLQHPPQDQGFLRHMKIINQDYNGNKYHKFSGSKFQLHPRVLEATVKASSKKNQPGQNFDDTTSEDMLLSQQKDDDNAALWRNWDAFCRFSRLYTVIGSISGAASISLLPLTSVRDLSPAFFVGLVKALIPVAFTNIYVNGINQIFDIEIDKINKPYLPLASGEYSVEQGKAIVAASGLMSLAMGIMFQSPPLFFGNLGALLIGTAYSLDLPLLRWKTKPFLAAFSMVGLALTSKLGIFYHIQKSVLGREIVFTKSLGFTLVFITLYFIAFALFKDIPDVDGDQEFGNRTFSVRLGKKKVFSITLTILMIAYGLAVVIGASSSIVLNKLVSVIGHCTIASFLWLRASSLNLDDNASVQSFYMLLWKLLNAEYVLIHFIR